MEHLTDQDIFDGCISGNRQAREAFVKRFSDFIYRSVQHALKVKDIYYNRSDLEELHNTVFVKLFENRCKKLRQYKGTNGCSLLSWVRLVTVRTVIDHLRKSHTDALTREGKTTSLDYIFEIQGEDPEPSALIEKGDQYRLIQENIQYLSTRDQLFLKLHFLKEMPIRQVAEIMDLSENNAYSVKNRVLKRMLLSV